MSSSARALLDPLFQEALGAFQEAGFSRVKRVRLVVTDSARDGERHFAACRTDGREILIAPEILQLDVDSAAAIIVHELGHATDFLYPSRYLLMDDSLHEWAHPDWELGAEEPHPRFAQNRMRQWEEREDDAIERTADAIGERVVGRKIYYGGPCCLQTFDTRGVRPRPAGLR